MSKVWVIAHRGASGVEVENTLAAFERAILMGIDYIELDVRKTSDGKVVVYHDSWIPGLGSIERLPLEQIERVVLRNGQHIATLEEVITFSRGRVRLLIELKTPGAWLAVLDLVERHGIGDQVIIASFHHPTALQVKQVTPRVKTGIINSGRLVDPSHALSSARADVLMQDVEMLDEELVAQVKAVQREVFAWTVNDEDSIRQAIALGVHGIISDYPERVMAMLAR